MSEKQKPMSVKAAAIYARFSSDLQTDKSIEDQLALCRELCAAAGLRVAAIFEDRAVSGASTVNRAGFQAMMRAAARHEFDVLVTEDIDRIARKQADFHAARDQLQFLGITIQTPAGVVGQLDGSLRALMSEMFLDNLAAKTRRGLRGVIRDGRHAGGRAYGYRAVPGQPGALGIVEAEAEIVREIFARYAEGETPRRIAADLNRRQIASPRGGAWNASTINGNHARKSGMLFNELYIGRIVWNRLRHAKNPTTGKRVPRVNDIAELLSAPAPQLRIIADDLWEKAQRRKAAQHAEHPSHARKPPRLLSGLIRCGSCGAGMAACSRDRKGMRLQCSAHRESGTCSNGRLVYRDELERRVLEGLHGVLAAPGYLDGFLQAYNDERRELRQNAGRDRARLERRQGEIARELQRAIDAIVKAGVDPATLAGRMRELEEEKAAVATALAEAAEADQVVTLHPATVERYRAALARLGDPPGGEDDAEREKQIEAVREVVASVIVHAAPGRGETRIEVRGRLDQLTEQTRFGVRSVSRGKVVAGARNSQSPTKPASPGFSFWIAA